MLTEAELLEITRAGESDRVEFTGAAKDMDKVRQAICAFANDLPNHKKPGFCFIGLDDDGKRSGLNIDDELLVRLGHLRNDGKMLPFPAMEVAKVNLNGCDVAVIQVEPSDNPPFRVDGRCWIRTGPQRGQATSEEERRLLEKRQWRNLPFDARGVLGSAIERDLDMERFKTEYLPSAIPLEILEENNRSPEQQLQALRLTDQNGTPTMAALLVLGKDPRDWFPGAYIQFVRYDGNEVTDNILDQAALSGPLPDQLRELEALLKRNIITALDTSDATHVERPDYPMEALRELARNAVIHRNYDNTNTPVRIMWFVNRVEISSPGSVYGSVTRENFGTRGVTDYRNPTLAAALKNIGFMQRFGMGIVIARKALSENGNPSPEFNIEDTFVSVTVRSNKPQ